MSTNLKTRHYIIAIIITCFVFLSMLFYRLSEIPPLQFDEGWTLSVARNWVETGQYARFLQGSPVTAYGFAKPFSVTGPIALSFFLFGVGTLQGRLPEIIFMVFAIFLIFHLAYELYGSKVAFLTLFSLFFINTPTANPWIIGRQAIAEAPMVFYLLTGYFFLYNTLKGRRYAFLGSIVFWGLALDSKGHVLPFWTASLFLVILYALLKKQKTLVKLILITWAGSFLVYGLMLMIQKALYSPYSVYGSTVENFFSLGVAAFSPQVRWTTLLDIIYYGIPVAIGIWMAGKRLARDYHAGGELPAEFSIKLSLLGLTASWFLWFAFLSLGWARYFFPISFFGSIFVAFLLQELLSSIKRLFSREFSHDLVARLRTYGLTLLVIANMSLYAYFNIYQVKIANNYPEQVAKFVQQNIGSNALIETYESELIFLLNNPIHFPPDQVNIDLNRKIFLGDNITTDYDPSAEKFEYLIDGHMSKLWGLYTPWIEKENLQLVFQSGEYTIYKRLP